MRQSIGNDGFSFPRAELIHRGASARLQQLQSLLSNP
jgi:hypothetical protein